MPLALVENAACMEIASQIAGWLILVIGLLALVIFALAVFTMVQAWYYLGHRKTELERDLGFRDGSACHVVDGKYESTVAIDAVEEGRPFALAGVCSGDVVPDLSHIGLFRLLHRRRGSIAELAVADGGEGPPFHQRPSRVIKINVPPACATRPRGG